MTDFMQLDMPEGFNDENSIEKMRQFLQRALNTVAYDEINSGIPGSLVRVDIPEKDLLASMIACIKNNDMDSLVSIAALVSAQDLNPYHEKYCTLELSFPFEAKETEMSKDNHDWEAIDSNHGKIVKISRCMRCGIMKIDTIDLESQMSYTEFRALSGARIYNPILEPLCVTTAAERKEIKEFNKIGRPLPSGVIDDAPKTPAPRFRAVVVPEGLNVKTEDAVLAFAQALLDKARAAELKYGYGSDWTSDKWSQDNAEDEIIEHLRKGDPIDVGLLCAFFLKNGWDTKGVMSAYSDV
jgi:hypothetical protein